MLINKVSTSALGTERLLNHVRSYAKVPRVNDDILAGYTQVKCEREVKSDGIMHTENASFRMLGKITEQADPANLGPQFYGNRAVSHD